MLGTLLSWAAPPPQSLLPPWDAAGSQRRVPSTAFCLRRDSAAEEKAYYGQMTISNALETPEKAYLRDIVFRGFLVALHEHQHRRLHRQSLSPQNFQGRVPFWLFRCSSYSETVVNCSSSAPRSFWIYYLESNWEQKSHANVFTRYLLEERKIKPKQKLLLFQES